MKEQTRAIASAKCKPTAQASAGSKREQQGETVHDSAGSRWNTRASFSRNKPGRGVRATRLRSPTKGQSQGKGAREGQVKVSMEKEDGVLR
jgi:hypothetical protein